jgi:hypothetical protein
VGDYTDLLYARPSALEGAARLFDIAGTLNKYNISESGAEADARAIRSDWYAVGMDARRALDVIRRRIQGR